MFLKNHMLWNYLNTLKNSNFAALKNCIILNVSLAKTEQNNRGVLSSVSQNYSKMNNVSEGIP